jgi:hypothetical protein
MEIKKAQPMKTVEIGLESYYKYVDNVRKLCKRYVKSTT